MAVIAGSTMTLLAGFGSAAGLFIPLLFANLHRDVVRELHHRHHSRRRGHTARAVSAIHIPPTPWR